MEEWWQHHFSLIALENKSNFQGCKTNWPPETQSTYALVYVISSCGGWLSDTDCSLCWLLVNELVVSVPTDTLLIRVREKLFFFNRPLIRCGWVRRVWVTTQMTRVNLVPRGREAALKSKHITWNWGNWSQVSTTNFFSVPVFSRGAITHRVDTALLAKPVVQTGKLQEECLSWSCCYRERNQADKKWLQVRFHQCMLGVLLPQLGLSERGNP